MIAFQFLAALWGSKPARYAAIALMVLLGARLWLWGHDNKIKDQAFQQIDTQARELTKQAVKAREGADKPGSEERLKRVYCRDCK